MTFVDTTVFMYAVGRPHPLREQARAFFLLAATEAMRLSTSTEVLQELLHAYLPVRRLQTLRDAFDLALGATHEVWPLELEDVRLARTIGETGAGIGARDALHLACCKRRGVKSIKTYDRALEVAFGA